MHRFCCPAGTAPLFRTLYLAADDLTAFRETVSRRPVDEMSLPEPVVPRQLNDRWFATTLTTRELILLDLRSRPGHAALAADETTYHSLSQPLARAVHDATSGTGPPFDGIAYPSRFNPPGRDGRGVGVALFDRAIGELELVTTEHFLESAAYRRLLDRDEIFLALEGEG